MDVSFGWGWRLLKKYNDVWKGVSNSIKEEFDSEPIYNKR